MRLVVIIGLSLLTLATSAKAMQPSPLSSYVQTVYRTQDGLPQDSVKAITQSRDGYIWVATQDGLARFDGVSFTPFNTKNSPGLVSNNIHDLVEDNEGNIWIFANNGLSRYKDGKFTVMTPNEGAGGDDRVKRIWIGLDGHLVVDTDLRCFRYADGHLVRIFSAEGMLPVVSVTSVLTDGTVAASDGVSLCLGSHGKNRIVPRMKQDTGMIHTLCADDAGGMWVGTDGGLYYYNARNRGLTVPPIAHSLQHRMVANVVHDGGGRLWVATDKGTYRIDKSKIDHFPKSQRFRYFQLGMRADGDDGVLYITEDLGQGTLYAQSGDHVSSLRFPTILALEWTFPVFRDREGDIWVGTFGGVYCLRKAPVLSYSGKNGLPSGRVMAGCQDRGGTVWVGTYNNGLYKLQGDRFRHITDGPLRTGTVLCLLADRYGSIWFAIENGKLYRYKDGKLEDVFAAVGMHNWISSHSAELREDRDGNVWFGSDRDLYLFSNAPPARDGTASRLTMLQHVVHNPGGVFDGTRRNDEVHGLNIDHAGRLWLGQKIGVVCVANGKVTRFGPRDGLPTVPVICGYVDPEGGIWFGTWGGGLYLYKNGKFRGVFTTDGLYSESIHQILGGEQGKLWIGSSRGIFYVNRRDIEAHLDDPARPITCTPLETSDGALSGSTSAPGQSSGWTGNDGNLWFAAIAGVMRVQPSFFEARNRSGKQLVLPTVIERVFIDGSSYRSDRSAVASPGSGRVQIDFAALCYARSGKIHFRYRLNGVDADWVDPDSRRSAFYTNLPPGQYRFDVQSYDPSGVIQLSPAAYSFTLQPHFYQTNWFRTVCAALFMMAIWAMQAVRLRSANRLNHLLEMRVAERTADLAQANEQLQSMHTELVAQNDELQNIQTELEIQNTELQNTRVTLEEQNVLLSRLATTDGLTGIANHRAFQEHIANQWSIAGRHMSPLSVTLIDVDRFKQFNDTYGHPAGDQVLREVAQLLRNAAREGDFVARYGGEEFVVVLPQTDREGAMAVAERLRIAVAEATWDTSPVTASFGVATMSLNMNAPGDMIALADKALYVSKQNGRNRCTHAEDIPQAGSLTSTP